MITDSSSLSFTDSPRFGVLCCGKTYTELGQSIACCSLITDLLKEGGFMLGGYHTALVGKDDPERLKMCTGKLCHLASVCDVIFTVGAEGFRPDDVIPDITEKLCGTRTAFFADNLCGALDIGNYDREKHARSSAVHPSRATAGICGKTLILNIRAERAFITRILPTLLPSVSFAVAGIAGKDAAESRRLYETFRRACDEAWQSKQII